MSIQFRSTANGQNTSATTIAISKPSGVLQGDLMIAWIHAFSGATASLSGWTAIGGLANTVLYKVAGASEPSSYTFTLSGSLTTSAGIICAYIGANNTSPIQTSATSSGFNGSNDINVAALSASRANSLFLVLAYATPNTPNTTTMAASPSTFNSRAIVKNTPSADMIVGIQFSDKVVGPGTTAPGVVDLVNPNGGSGGANSVLINPKQNQLVVA